MLENKLSRVGGGAGNVVVAAQDMWGGGAGYVVAGLTENKIKPSSWGLAELGNNFKMSRHGLLLGIKYPKSYVDKIP